MFCFSQRQTGKISLDLLGSLDFVKFRLSKMPKAELTEMVRGHSIFNNYVDKMRGEGVKKC